jgi:hypothetical protein
MNIKHKFGWAAVIAVTTIGSLGLTGVGSAGTARPATVTSLADHARPATTAVLDDAPITSPATTKITLDMSECGLMYLKIFNGGGY